MKNISIQKLFSEITSIPTDLDQKTYPSLNGMRAVSIIMVLVYHITAHYYNHFPGLEFIGALVVNVFFVISGFLITTLCIKEKVLTGDLSLKDFYIRRIFRILPVAYLYILVIFLLNYFFQLHLTILNFAAALLFLYNLSFFNKSANDWDLKHFWSLSTEEQFYIIFPVFIKKNFGVFVAVILFITLIVPVLFFAQLILPQLNFNLLTFFLKYLFKFQGIAVGCLCAILLFKGYIKPVKNGTLVSLAIVLICCLLKFDMGQSAKACLTDLILSLLIAFFIVNNIHPVKGFVYKFLNFKFLSWLGMLSYSIYLWQQLFLSNDSKLAFTAFPLNMLFLIVVPIMSYYGYEKYFLKLKKKFSHLKR